MDEAEELEASFDAFYRRAAPGLVRLAFARTGSWSIGEEPVQDAMADAHRRWAEVAGFDDPSAWVRRAVLNRSASVLRRRSREHRALERVASRPALDHPEPAFADEALWSALRGLSDRQADVVLLLWFEDLPVAEVAATLGCGEETVRTHWRRARERLASVLGETDDEPPAPVEQEGAGR